MRASRVSQLGLAAVSTLLIALAMVLPFISPYPPGDLNTPEGQAFGAAVKLVWLAAVLAARARQPGSRLWKLMLAYVLVSGVWAFGFIPNGVIASYSRIFARLDLALLAHVLVVFPSGHLKTRFDRLVIGSAYALVLVPALMSALVWDSSGCNCPPNVFLVWPNNDLDWRIGQAAQLASPIVGGLVLFAVWRHWRGAGPLARRALLPVILAVPLAVLTPITMVGAVLGTDFWGLGRLPSYDVGLLILPAALLIGVLRLRLDRGRVAGLVVELGGGVPVGALRDALARALGDPTLELAFADPNSIGYIDPAGRPVEVPFEDAARSVARVEQGHDLLAVLIYDRTLDDEDPGLVEAVGSAARLALDNERLSAQVRAQLEEVRASRARIVEAADAERRRVERDLHDGAQQRLVALAMRLQLAQVRAGEKSALIDDTTSELEAAIREVRDLARGVHPAILTEAGLAAALETLAERSPVPVRIDAHEARYRPAIEVTAFYVVSEALTNTARYAAATEALVSVSGNDDWLTVTVADDGRGGADATGGSGLRGLADRVAAVGGRLTVTSPMGGGTTISAVLPLA